MCTKFINGAMDSFLHGIDETTTCSGKGEWRRLQIMPSSAQNTHSLRYNNHANFFKVDLLDVIKGKGRLQRY